MLVLTRKTNEPIFLTTSDGLIEIEITAAAAGGVKIGITAPAQVGIHRDRGRASRDACARAGLPGCRE